jgi:hypothetical protein
MNKVVDLTVDVLQRVGDTLGRHLSTEDKHDYGYVQRSVSGYMFPSAGSAFHRPLDKKNHKKKVYSAKQRDLIYGGARQYSSDNLAASPGYSSFSNYRQSPMPNPYADGVDRPPYGTGIGGPLNYAYNSNNGYGSFYSGGYSDPSSNMPYGAFPGSVGYAPDYYIAERRQVELVPAPPPRIIQQPYPVGVPVDRPVPQPYPVEVIRQVPVDRPVPVPVPSPVPVDRHVLVPVPVPVPSPPPPPVCVPVPYAVPCYVPVGIPVPSPPPSPVMFEQSVTHSQRWVTGSPAMGMNPYLSYSNGSFIR